MVNLLHHGRVVRVDGSGVPDAVVYVTRGTAPTPEIAIRCDTQGRFRIALPPGKFDIEAQSPDGASGRTTVEIEAGLVDIVILVGASE